MTFLSFDSSIDLGLVDGIVANMESMSDDMSKSSISLLSDVDSIEMERILDCCCCCCRVGVFKPSMFIVNLVPIDCCWLGVSVLGETRVVDEETGELDVLFIVVVDGVGMAFDSFKVDCDGMFMVNLGFLLFAVLLVVELSNDSAFGLDIVMLNAFVVDEGVDDEHIDDDVGICVNNDDDDDDDDEGDMQGFLLINVFMRLVDALPFISKSESISLMIECVERMVGFFFTLA